MEPGTLLDHENVRTLIVMAFSLKIVVFILGFLTIRLGHSLIRDGVKGGFKFSTEARGVKGALQSSSPGLLFVLLGVLLIAYGMWVKQDVKLHEGTENTPAGKEMPAAYPASDSQQSPTTN